MPLPLIYIFHPYIRYIYNYYIVHIKACKRSTASSPRISPTMILLGAIRRAVRIRSRIVIARFPSILAGFASRRTRFSTPWICSSAESSIVIIRSSWGIALDNAFRNVVLPEEVPPPIRIEYPARTAVCSPCNTSLK